MNNGIDFIGDIHGYARELEILLLKMGYIESPEGYYYHPDGRKVLFIGDYIDRGPNIRETLQVVKAMTDSGNAIALMGNHEYNSLLFHMKDEEGNYLRKHSEKNKSQFKETKKAFEKFSDEWEMYMDWFKTLPLYYETDDFRAVHACWDNDNIDFLRGKLINDRLTDELIRKSARKNTPFNDAIDQTLKGKEMDLPAGSSFPDADGAIRDKIRIKWWQNPKGKTYKEMGFAEIQEKEELDKVVDLNSTDTEQFKPYCKDEKPVFFGHYWIQEEPKLFRENICCVDFSIAKKGVLAAYRFDGEKVLDKSNFVWIEQIKKD